MPDRIITRITALPKPETCKDAVKSVQRVAAYARVSTDHEEQETSLTAQTDYYRKKILEHPGWELVGIYVDDGISGLSTNRRDGFNRMVEDCIAGHMDLILTKSISRFARNTVDTVTTIRKLKEKGVGVYFEKENIFTTDSKGEFLLTIMSSLAQEESRSISENVTWGQRKRMADGKVSLAYSRFLGYDKGKGKYEMVVNEEQAVTVRRIFFMFLQGYAMKSDNPHSGIYEAETARTLDGNGGNPSCNQGGIAVVAFTQNQRDEVRDLGDRSAVVCANAGTKQQTFVLQGSMIGRDDKNGPQGDGINEDVSFTLNTVDRHAVYSMTTGSFTQVSKEKAPTVLARDYKDPTAVCYGIGRDTFNQGQNAKFAPTFEEELQPTLVAKGPGAIQNGYTVRRLTPTECARLQGFPDDWCADLGTEKPTDEEMYFWHKVFKTYSEVTGCKMKSDKQIAKWLKDPYSDSAEYKMWGNGVALPCVWFVLCGIVWYAQSGGDNVPI